MSMSVSLRNTNTTLCYRANAGGRGGRGLCPPLDTPKLISKKIYQNIPGEEQANISQCLTKNIQNRTLVNKCTEKNEQDKGIGTNTTVQHRYVDTIRLPAAVYTNYDVKHEGMCIT